jgi:hypothetical protein
MASSQSSLSSSSSSLFDMITTVDLLCVYEVFNSSLTSGNDTHKVQVKPTDTRDLTASNRDDQSRACCVFLPQESCLWTIFPPQEQVAHTVVFPPQGPRLPAGARFVKSKSRHRSRATAIHSAETLTKGHHDSFRRKGMMKGHEDSSRSGIKIRSAPEIAYDSYRCRNSMTLFQQGLDIMIYASNGYHDLCFQEASMTLLVFSVRSFACSACLWSARFLTRRVSIQ